MVNTVGVLWARQELGVGRTAVKEDCVKRMIFECGAVRRNIHWMTTLQMGNHLQRLGDKVFECLQ